MLTIENTTVIANVDIKPGMFILDGIMSRVETVVYADTTGVCIVVEDGNGYVSQLRMAFEGFTRTYGWSEEDWQGYRAM